MTECALCDEKFPPGSNNLEHVIPNAIGGRRKVKEFLCEVCNSRSGYTWDADLAKQLNGLSLFFAVDRERGVPAPQEFKTLGGQPILLTESGIRPAMPICKVEFTEGRVSIQTQTRTHAEARKMLTGLKRKYPKIDVEGSLAKAVSHRFYLDDMVELRMQFGGQGSGRSMVKTALALASAAGVSPVHCDEARRYLRSGEDPCFGFYYTRDLVKNRPDKTVMHCVVVKSTSDGLLLGYVEFFSIFKMVVCLSKIYNGPNVSECYAVDPHNRQNFNLDVDLSFTLKDINDIKAYKDYTSTGLERVLHLAIPVGMQRSVDREWKAVTQQAAKNAWENCGAREGDTLTREHIATLSRLFAERVTPMVIHFKKRGLQPSTAVLPLDRALPQA